MGDVGGAFRHRLLPPSPPPAPATERPPRGCAPAARPVQWGGMTALSAPSWCGWDSVSARLPLQQILSSFLSPQPLVLKKI